MPCAWGGICLTALLIEPSDPQYRGGLVAIRFILALLFVLGLITAWCSQAGEGMLMASTSSIRQAIDG